jgi:hypothetical protein
LISHENDFAKEFDYCVNRTETPEEYEGWWAMLGEKYKLQDNEFFQSISATRSMWAPDTSEGTSFLSRAQQEGLKA